MTRDPEKTPAPQEPVLLTLTPTHQYFHPLKTLPIFPNQTLNIGRFVGTDETLPERDNGYYESPAMSRRHCIFFSTCDGDDRKLFIQDLGTLNGTYLNGTRLGTEGHASVPVPVEGGDCIVFAHNVSMEGVLYTSVEVKVDIEY
ncbi:hypothetical protein IQ06DRAFT_311129 [Phaeosphaeriaceae sp. SRC1lsM3a]|nr:hypothetical protein IQ06DRAFT_311129 [Stagonospora sp. SRC1lsM3a]